MLTVTILKISIVVKIQYKITLICCWYSCCVQTSAFQSSFK